MFRGESPELRDVLRRALGCARDLGQPRAGSEHLLLALTLDGRTADLLARLGATTARLRDAVAAAGPAGAGAAADRELLAVLGPGLDGLVSAAPLDRPAGRVPFLPLGAGRSRRRCARMRPPLGLDAQAVWAVSLRLALARRDAQHRPEHLALALVTLDPGAAWILRRAEVSRPALAAGLAAAFPPPSGRLLLRADRRLGRRARARDLVRRYQRMTGRTVTDSPAITALISG
jgi:Clp amino terminal domain, pathogenicity island component